MKKVILEGVVFFVISFCAVQVSLSNYVNIINHKLLPDQFISPRKTIQVQKIPIEQPIDITTGTVMVYMQNTQVVNMVRFSNAEIKVLEGLAKKIDSKEFEAFMLTAFVKNRQQFMIEAKRKFARTDFAYNK
jgi:hypothetical protein